MNRIQSAKRDAELFRKWFTDKYGIQPDIIYTFPEKNPKFSLDELVGVINEIVKQHPFEYDEEDACIEILSREEMLVLYRQIYYYLGNHYGYKLVDIARGLKKIKTRNHATVLHGINVIKKQIELGDKKTITKLKLVLDAVKEKLGTDGNVPPNHNEELKPESVLSPVLPEGKPNKSKHKPAPRTQELNHDWVC